MARRYPKEFKLEAVRLSELPDRTAVSVAKELDINVETLYVWRRKYKKDGDDAFPGKGNLTPEQAEIASLKKASAQARARARDTKKSHEYLRRQGTGVRYEFIESHLGRVSDHADV